MDDAAVAQRESICGTDALCTNQCAFGWVNLSLVLHCWCDRGCNSSSVLVAAQLMSLGTSLLIESYLLLFAFSPMMPLSPLHTSLWQTQNIALTRTCVCPTCNLWRFYLGTNGNNSRFNTSHCDLPCSIAAMHDQLIIMDSLWAFLSPSHASHFSIGAGLYLVLPYLLLLTTCTIESRRWYLLLSNC